METKQEQIKMFLENNEQRQLTIKDSSATNWATLFYKVNFNEFDFIYELSIYNGTPNTDSKAEFAGVIKRDTKQLYFARYSLYKIFEVRNAERYTTTLNYITDEQLTKDINNDIIKALAKMAETVADDMTPDENDFEIAKGETEQYYFYNDISKLYRKTPGTSTKRTTSELLAYISNPTTYINELLTNKEKSQDPNDRPSQTIKYNKMMDRLQEQIIEKIKTAPEYAKMRQAIQIKNSIPAEANQINVFYLLSNGEVLTGKYDAKELKNRPYWDYCDKEHYSSYNFEKSARDKLKEVDGYDRNDIYLSNIIKLTYKGKTIYSNPDHNTEGGL